MITDFENLPYWQVFVAVCTEKLSMAGFGWDEKNERSAYICAYNLSYICKLYNYRVYLYRDVLLIRFYVSKYG